MKVYLWNTPNGYKIPIMLEELGLEYEIVAVDINNGKQLQPEFLAMNPNHKIPVIDDDGLILFESGAILLYLAEKYGKFLPQETKAKYVTIEWLMFQMANVGPMFGQANHFVKHAPEKIQYGIDRYVKEANRLAKILDDRLAQLPYLAGNYSIADMATWPWVRSAINNKHFAIETYPDMQKWFDSIAARSAVQKALEKTDAATKKAPEVCPI